LVCEVYAPGTCEDILAIMVMASPDLHKVQAKLFPAEADAAAAAAPKKCIIKLMASTVSDIETLLDKLWALQQQRKRLVVMEVYANSRG